MLWIPRSDVKVLLADPVYVEEIAQLHYQAFSDPEETLEVSRRYITEALKDSDGLLYILLKEGQVIGVCTVDLSGNSNYLYGLAVAESLSWPRLWKLSGKISRQSTHCAK